jgi:outer membrane protein assembly factor BamB
VLVLPSAQQSVPYDDSTAYIFTETAALDAATGQERWRVPGSPADSGVDGRMLIEEHEPEQVATAALRMIDLADGRTIWRRATPGVQTWVEIGADPDRPDRLATVTAAGRVRVLSMADGTEVDAGRIPWNFDPDQAIYTLLEAHGDAFYALRVDQRSASATAYSDSGLTRLWTVTRATGNDNGAVRPCGPVLCVSGNDGLTGLDWATGAVWWHDPGQVYAGDGGTGLILATSTDSAHRSLIDEATGRVVADLDGKPAAGRVDGPVITIAPSQAPPGRTVVRQVDPRTGETLLLGATDAVDDLGCTLAGKYLLCRTLLGRLTVTAVD